MAREWPDMLMITSSPRRSRVAGVACPRATGASLGQPGPVLPLWGRYRGPGAPVREGQPILGGPGTFHRI